MINETAMLTGVGDFFVKEGVAVPPVVNPYFKHDHSNDLGLTDIAVNSAPITGLKSLADQGLDYAGRRMTNSAIKGFGESITDGISNAGSYLKDTVTKHPYLSAGIGAAAIGLPFLLMNRKKQEQPPINVNIGAPPQQGTGQMSFPKPGITG